MGLFDSGRRNKEIKKVAEWNQALMPTLLELNEDHMKLTTAAETDIVFYKDIVDIQQVSRIVTIKTLRKTYTLTARKRRGGGEKAADLQMQLLELMQKNK